MAEREYGLMHGGATEVYEGAEDAWRAWDDQAGTMVVSRWVDGPVRGPWEPVEDDGPPGKLRCCQCGREGTRDFRVIPVAVHPPTGARLGPFVVCAHQQACYRRRVKLGRRG